MSSDEDYVRYLKEKSNPEVGVIFDWFGVCAEKWIDVWKREMKGNVDEEPLKRSFFKHLDKYANNTLTGQQFLENVFCDLGINYKEYGYLIEEHGKINEELMSNIIKLKRKYRIALLSDNFNEIRPIIEKDIGGFDKYFDVIVLSNELNIGKIDDRIYETTLDRLGLSGDKCVFIDDKEKNLVIARKFGIKTILYENNSQLKQDLEKFGVNYGDD